MCDPLLQVSLRGYWCCFIHEHAYLVTYLVDIIIQFISLHIIHRYMKGPVLVLNGELFSLAFVLGGLGSKLNSGERILYTHTRPGELIVNIEEEEEENIPGLYRNENNNNNKQILHFWIHNISHGTGSRIAIVRHKKASAPMDGDGDGETRQTLF